VIAKKNFSDDQEGSGWRWLHFVLMVLVILVALITIAAFIIEVWNFKPPK